MPSRYLSPLDAVHLPDNVPIFCNERDHSLGGECQDEGGLFSANPQQAILNNSIIFAMTSALLMIDLSMFDAYSTTQD